MLEIVRNAFLTGNDRARDWMKIAAPSPTELKKEKKKKK
jgi:magnesium transporter